MDAMEKFLLESGAGMIGHSGRTLYDHLLGTRRILASWRVEEHIERAGLMHSVFGTVSFHRALIDVTKSKELAELIGFKAYELVVLFQRIKRGERLLSAYDHGQAVFSGANALDGRKDEFVPISKESALSLIILDCANLLEQRAGDRFMKLVLERCRQNTLPLPDSVRASLEREQSFVPSDALLTSAVNVRV